ncbi:uncharacterized protein M6B38_381390 [Iris pallida]|uniref:Uncharacterized protein n=1 Tax=Iris pallida TaxID=29817 RepID=A0AAX6G724_IRIPA|nr:uncharacterized protein M6B38_381390 [Iris pallida]
MCLFMYLFQPVTYASGISNLVHISCLVLQDSGFRIYFMYFISCASLYLYSCSFMFFSCDLHSCTFLFFLLVPYIHVLFYHDVLVHYLELYFAPLLTGYVVGVVYSTLAFMTYRMR